MSGASETSLGSQSFNVVGQGISAAEGAAVQVRDINIQNHGHQLSSKVSLRDALRFPEIRSREHAIDNAHGGTCEWLLKTKQYQSWTEEVSIDWRHRLLWIKGNAGAGKSTMMKFAVEHARRTSADEFILPHFFNARGSALEHSVEGMYRTLIFWLLDAVPQDTVQKLDTQYDNRSTTSAWQIPGLVRLLKAMVQALDDRPIAFYIDALDECRDDEVRTMIKVFRDLVQRAWATGRRVRVCFASRPYPVITFTDAVFLDFSDQAEHIEDITKYIEDELEIGHSPLARDIKVQVRAKAAGSFMWTVLCVGILNKEHDRGRMDFLSQRLQDIPPGLHNLYDHLLERFPQDRDAFLACCRVLLFIRGSATAGEIWWAARWVQSRDQAAAQEAYGTLEEGDMKRYIIDMSKGLIEFWTLDGECRAQFLHESVRDYLLNESQLLRLSGCENHRAFESESHELLRDCCAATFEAHQPRLLNQVRTKESSITVIPWGKFPGWRASRDEDEKVPVFFAYAMTSWMIHAERLQQLGLDQTAFLDSFTQRCGSRFLSPSGARPANLRGDEMKYGAFVVYPALIGVLLEHVCSALIRETQLQSAREARRQRKPLGLARHTFLGGMDWECTEALIDLYLRLERRHPDLQRMLQHLASAKKKSGPPYRGPRNRWRTMELPLLERGWDDPSLALFLLLSLAPAGSLEPHLRRLESITTIEMPDYQSRRSNWSRHFAQFLLILYVFVELRLPCEAIDFGDARLLSWIQSRKQHRLRHGRFAWETDVARLEPSESVFSTDSDDDDSGSDSDDDDSGSDSDEIDSGSDSDEIDSGSDSDEIDSGSDSDDNIDVESDDNIDVESDEDSDDESDESDFDTDPHMDIEPEPDKDDFDADSDERGRANDLDEFDVEDDMPDLAVMAKLEALLYARRRLLAGPSLQAQTPAIPRFSFAFIVDLYGHISATDMNVV